MDFSSEICIGFIFFCFKIGKSVLGLPHSQKGITINMQKFYRNRKNGSATVLKEAEGNPFNIFWR